MESAEHPRGSKGEEGDSRRDVTGQDPAGGRAACGRSQREEEEEPSPRRKPKRLSPAQFHPGTQTPRGVWSERTSSPKAAAWFRLSSETALATRPKRFTPSSVFNAKLLAKSNVRWIPPAPRCFAAPKNFRSPGAASQPSAWQSPLDHHKAPDWDQARPNPREPTSEGVQTPGLPGQERGGEGRRPSRIHWQSQSETRVRRLR